MDEATIIRRAVEGGEGRRTGEGARVWAREPPAQSFDLVEASRASGFQVHELKEAIRAGEVEATKEGGRWQVTREALRAFWKARRVRAEGEAKGSGKNRPGD